MVVEIVSLGRDQNQLFSPALGPCTEDSQVSCLCEKTLGEKRYMTIFTEKVQNIKPHLVTELPTMFMNEGKPLKYLKHYVSNSRFRKQSCPAARNRQIVSIHQISYSSKCVGKTYLSFISWYKFSFMYSKIKYKWSFSRITSLSLITLAWLSFFKDWKKMNSLCKSMWST